MISLLTSKINDWSRTIWVNILTRLLILLWVFPQELLDHSLSRINKPVVDLAYRQFRLFRHLNLLCLRRIWVFEILQKPLLHHTRRFYWNFAISTFLSRLLYLFLFLWLLFALCQLLWQNTCVSFDNALQICYFVYQLSEY